MMTTTTLPELDSLGRVRPPATRKGHRKGEHPPNYGRKFPVELLTPEEMQRLLEAALWGQGLRNGRSVPFRNHALIVLLWRCGLRCGEALAIMPSDLNLADATLRIRKSKTVAGLRTVGLDPVALEALQWWLAVRAELGIGDDSPVFCTVQQGPSVGERGRPMGAPQWRETIKKITRRAGITKRVSSHSLRHQFASEAIREQTPLPVISRMLGHAGTAITHRYLSHSIGPAEAVDMMKARKSGDEPGRRVDADTDQSSAGVVAALDALVDRLLDGMDSRLRPAKKQDSYADRAASVLNAQPTMRIAAAPSAPGGFTLRLPVLPASRTVTRPQAPPTPLREALERKDMPRSAFADLIRVERELVDQWVAGDAIPAPAQCLCIAQALDESVLALWPDARASLQTRKGELA